MTIETVSFKNSPALRLTLPDGAEAIVLLHGAHVVSWKPDGKTERLYLSDKADFSPGSAIRGGVPVCFPQFSTLGPCAMHGFARTMVWRPGEMETGTDRTTARLELSETPETLSVWPHAFKAVLDVILDAKSLCIRLNVQNTGAAPLTFTSALHTYLRIGNIDDVAITGLEGLTYHDKVTGQENQKETRRELTFAGQTDRIYYKAPKVLTLRDGARLMELHTDNMPDAVIWNPGLERALTIPDLPDDGYQFMVCIEAAAIAQPVRLEAGKSWSGSQILKA